MSDMQIDSMVTITGAEYERLRAENERLKASEEAYRKTLRGIVRQCNNTGYGSPSVMERMIDRIEDMAIDALGTHRHASKEVND